jgi:polysaccharide biosynthesis protein PslJ
MIDQRADLLLPSLEQGRKFDSVSLLTFYLFFLLAIPSRLQFAPLGGAGAPSTILGALFFVWYMLNWLHPSSRIDIGPQPMRRAAALFLCTITITYTLANEHGLPTLELNGADRGLILAFSWLGVLLLAADGIDTMMRLQVLFRRLVFGATAMAVLGVIQFFTGLNAAQYILIPGLNISQPYSDVLSRGSFNRPSATAIHPIEFGFVLVMILPLAIHQARYAPRQLRVRRWLQVAVISATLPMTVSRSAMVGLILCLLVILPVWPKAERRLAYVVTVFSLFALRAVIPGLIGTIRNLFLNAGSDSSALSRTAAFGHAVPLITAHPWFGQGFGTFLPNTLFYTDDQYLNSLIEIGAVGLLVLLGLFATGWVLARRARRRTADPETRHLMQCLAASMAVGAFGYATFDALYFPMAAALTFLMLGCVGAAWRLAGDRVRREPTISGGRRGSPTALAHGGFS